MIPIRPLLGRSRELDLARAHVHAAERGEGGVVLLSGPTGIGKTRLLAEALPPAAHRRWHLEGRCTAIGGLGLAFEPWLEVFRTMARIDRAGPSLQLARSRCPELDLLLPAAPPERGSTGATPLGLAEAVPAMLVELARERPLVVVLEDLHWADRSTVELFAALAGQVAQAPLLLVATFRTEQVPPEHALHGALTALHGAPQVHRIELAPLRPDAVTALAAAVLGPDPAPDVVEQVLRRAEGNPLFASELLAHVAAGGSSADLPRSVHTLLLCRVAELSGGTVEALRAVAVAGREVPLDLLATVIEWDVDQVTEMVRPAEAAGLAFRADGVVGLGHALLQEALYAAMRPTQRRRLHARFAAALDARHRVASSDVAHHYDRAGDHRSALRAYAAAADAAMRTQAHAEASALLHHVLELWDAVPEAEQVAGRSRGAVRQAAVSEAVVSGAGPTVRALAESILAGAAADPHPAGQAFAYQGLAWGIFSVECDLQSALAAATTAVEMLDSSPASAEKAACVAMHAKLLLIGNRYEVAGAAGERALTLARDVGSRAWECDSLTTVAFCQYRFGALEEARTLLQRAQRMARDDLSALNGGYAAYMYEAEIVNRLGRHREAAGIARRGLELTTLHGSEALGLVLVWALGTALARLAEWREVEALLDAPRGVQGVLWLDRALAMVRCEVAVRRGRFAEAQRLLAFVARPPADPSSQVDVHPLRVELAGWRRDVPAARRATALALDAASVHRCTLLLPELCAHAIRVEGAAIESARLRGDDREAEHVLERVDRLEDVAERAVKVAWETYPAGLPSHLAGWKALCDAEAALVRGRDELDVWRAAQDAFDLGENPFHIAYGAGRLGAAQQRLGHPGADATLADAEELAVTHDLAPLAEQLAGLRRPLDRRTAHPERGPALTVRERQVLDGVARGWTNGRIAEELGMSARTVGTHVSSILRKLDVPTRARAVAAARSAGILP